MGAWNPPLLRAGLLVAALAPALSPAWSAAPPPAPAPSPADLRAEILKADQALFKAIFDDFDAGALEGMVTDDFEFLHDRWGQIAKSKAEFIAVIRRGCERQKTGVDFKAQRELLLDTLRVYPLKGYGAVEMGRHRFYKVEAGKPDTPTEEAPFIQVWRFVDGHWRLARVISYDHQPLTAPASGR